MQYLFILAQLIDVTYFILKGEMVRRCGNISPDRKDRFKRKGIPAFQLYLRLGKLRPEVRRGACRAWKHASLGNR